LIFDDVKRRAADVAKATAQRIMPPWLPEAGHGEFLNERRLTTEQIAIIQRWVSEGAIEGNPADLPPLPKWNNDWQLGAPDLVATMPAPYTLAAEGRDVYRNFVVPVNGLSRPRYVRALELRPGNWRIVHHAFIAVDKTAQSRRLDEQDAEVGFSGMMGPAEMPDGYFLGWQPGRLAMEMPAGLPWRLDPGTDLVLKTHLNPSGKPESMQASVGLYFTDEPPTNTCLRIVLGSVAIDIPAGKSNYVVEDSFVLPIDALVLAVLPHAHYLGKEMHGWAALPDGSQRELLLIKQWDFNWQGEYRYKAPVELPKGTRLSMRFSYDNSTNNLRNPNNPPAEITYGRQSRDEMAELWFQLIPKNRDEAKIFARARDQKVTEQLRANYEWQLSKNPKNAEAHVGLGAIFLMAENNAEAAPHFLAAIEAEPNLAPAHYYMGLLYRGEDKLAAAKGEFQTAIRLDPRDGKAHGNLGFVLLELGEAAAARSEFAEALKINPQDSLARTGLKEAAQTARRRVPR
jgi:tetratricopeptide (TPR) repeat protein